MSEADRDDAEKEPVVVRDRRRIDPVTGEVRRPAGDEGATAPSASEQTAGVGDTGAAPASDDEKRIAELEAQVAERTADLQRLSAEYANYRRRVERDREAVLTTARAQVLGELMTVLDDLDRAEEHGDLTGAFKAVADKLVAVVQKQGLEGFGTVGEPFDPTVHEAVQHEPADGSGPTVAVVSAVLRRGYRIGDRLLRPALVTVADRPVEDVEAAPDDTTTTGAERKPEPPASAEAEADAGQG